MSEVPSTAKLNVYEAITNKIVAMISVGAGTYHTPWHVPGAMTLPTNAATLAQYRGINVLSLWIERQMREYASGFWASYRQWQQMGAQVRKGERGAMIVFYKRVETTPDEEDHDRTGKLRFFARASYVFNAAQVDGYTLEEPESLSEFQRVEEIEAFVSAVGAAIKHGFPMACYRRDTDAIEMPRRDWFLGTDASSVTTNYYAVLLHELTHWSGAPLRLNRTFGRRFGDMAYAMEELVAELGAAFMCAAFGISSDPRPDHAAYVSSWLQVLNRDAKAIFTAASRAQEAFEHLAYLATKPDLDQER